MDQLTDQPGQDQGADYDYEHAERMIARIKRAITDPAYRTALLTAYREIFGVEKVPALVRAINTYRVNDAGELVHA